jgi:Subtilase family
MPATPDQMVDARNLPCVAVVDTGIPKDHAFLAAFRRPQFISPESVGQAVGDHGSRVASRVVFGDLEYSDRPPDPIPPGTCAFYDVNVAKDRSDLHEKEIIPSLEAVVGNAPDVRVFTLCFDSKQALYDLDEVTRREKLFLLQDLDNFVFARDVLVVIAAGNSPPNVSPSEAYPRHFDDPVWQLGTWPRCFNALTCGSIAGHLSADGQAREIGAASPFSRVGPGLARSPKPDLAAPGGNADMTFRYQPGLGVWCCCANGLWEDCCGTSYAAPILAREAALTMRYLQGFCDGDIRPFAATVKALLALTAERPLLSEPLIPLANRALGHGVANISRLRDPSPTRAMFVWQGVLERQDDLVRVQIPIPCDWLESSEQPRLRVSLAWDSPVNAAVEGVWASRKVTFRLRFTPDGRALAGSHGAAGSYPLTIREFELKKWPKGEEPSGDLWILELSYQQTAEDYIGLTFSPQQRAAFAAELFDAAERPIPPYSALERVPLCKTMTRLGIRPPIRNPVAIKVRT